MSLITKYQRRPGALSRTIATNENEHQAELGITEHTHTPSWKRFGDGSFNIEFVGNKTRGHVSICASEFSRDTKANRQVMMTLDQVEARALRDMLNKLNLGEGV